MRLELTKRADYAIRAVLALAGAADGERLSVRRDRGRPADPGAVPPQVMRDLVRGRARRGHASAGRGGYRLAKPAAAISLLDVVEAVEGDSRRRVCVLRGGPCALDGVCDVHAVFAAAQEDLLGRLRATTIAAAVRSD